MKQSKYFAAVASINTVTGRIYIDQEFQFSDTATILKNKSLWRECSDIYSLPNKNCVSFEFMARDLQDVSQELINQGFHELACNVQEQKNILRNPDDWYNHDMPSMKNETVFDPSGTYEIAKTLA